MLAIVSPAKSLDLTPVEGIQSDQHRFQHDSKILVNILKKKSAKKLRELMHISDDLAKLNVQRYQDFEEIFTNNNSKPAILTFDGDVYSGLDAKTLKKSELNRAQKSIRILSGLYGLLRPFDLIQPYRLEMGTRLKNRRGTNLYKFWGDRITNQLIEDIEDTNSACVLNLASKEYWKAVHEKKLPVPVYHFDFLENRNGKYQFISFTAKKARGWMCRFMLQNRIQNPEELKAFEAEGYRFNADLSAPYRFVYTMEP